MIEVRPELLRVLALYLTRKLASVKSVLHPDGPRAEVCENIIFETRLAFRRFWVNPLRTAVPFWGQTSQIQSNFSLKRDRGSEGVKEPRHPEHVFAGRCYMYGRARPLSCSQYTSSDICVLSRVFFGCLSWPVSQCVDVCCIFSDQTIITTDISSRSPYLYYCAPI